MKRIAIVLVLVLCGTSMLAADVKKSIRAMADTFEAGVRAGSAEQMAKMYADDAILMPPNAPAAKGKAAIQEFWGGMMAMGKSDLKLTIDDISIDGKTAIERGTWNLTLTPTGAADAIHDNGKYVIVWRNRGGKWQAVSDIYNSDNPPAPAAH